MGGKNPVYITRNADLVRAAHGVARSAFGLQGQKCSACSVSYVDKVVKDEFIEKLVAFSPGLIVGDPRKSKTFMGPVYGKATVERFRSAVAEAKEGKVHFGGRVCRDGNVCYDCINNFTAMIHGYGQPEVVAAVAD
jgi:1-pyrroline-5-carboxylate dehydrogenase